MARYIDADALIKEVSSLEQLARKRVYDTPTNSPAYERYATQYTERERMLCIINAQPTADVEEVRHGEWGFDGLGWTCSECGEYALANNGKLQLHSRHCPHCGAKMDGERR